MPHMKGRTLTPHTTHQFFSNFVNDDGSRRLLEKAHEMEEVFPTYDLSGNRVTTVNTHYRMLTESCSAEFAVPDCEGSCDGCSWT